MASTTELIAWQFHATLWPAVVGMGWLAAFVALDLARRIPASVDTVPRRLWLTGAALALGTGIWSNHFIGMIGEQAPLGMGYGGALSGLAWLAAVAGASVSLFLACCSNAGRARTFLAALVLGVAGLAAEVLCFADLAMAPALVWNPVWAVAAALAIALGVVPVYRWLQHSAAQPAPPRRLHQIAVAALVGLALAAAHQASAWAAQLPIDAVSLHHLGVLSGNALTLLASVGSLFLLTSLLLLSVMESRMRSALQNAAGQIVEATQNDALTGLLNRRSFERCLEIAAIRADASASPLAVLFIGLDSFKPVNDTFGRGVGDQLLCEMARRLRATARPGDKVARVGGDEFAVLMAFESDKADAAALARRLIAAMAEAAVIDGRHVQVTGSVGMVLYPQHGVHSTSLMHAEAAAHSVKRSGGAACAFFEPHMLGGAREQLDMLRDLRLAIKNQELELFFQPKIHAPSGEITGAEALMRWHHPHRGMVSPAVFIPLAERYGLINELGNWLIEDACRQARAWRDAGLRMRVAINLSVHQLGQDGLVERIRDTLARYRIEPKQLTCEITESAAMDDTRATLAVIEQLSAAGVHLSIDDFGTGYSSLAYLRKLPAEELKIDRSFVLDLETSADARAVVDAVVQLAKALGLKVVAEGVETEAQQQILRSLGCDELQGYLFAKPMSAQALLLWAMNDDGPRALDFRDSLFQLTQPAGLH